MTSVFSVTQKPDIQAAVPTRVKHRMNRNTGTMTPGNAVQKGIWEYADAGDFAVQSGHDNL